MEELLVKHETFKKISRYSAIIGMTCGTIAIAQNFIMIWMVSKLVFEY
jgi:hypothetical protein